MVPLNAKCAREGMRRAGRRGTPPSGPFSVKRRLPRRVPQQAVTVALLKQGAPFAYGVVKDLSEGGACLLTNAKAIQDSGLQVKMSFYNDQILEVKARVVWSAECSESVWSENSYGVEFVELSQPNGERLRTILRSPDFTVREGGTS